MCDRIVLWRSLCVTNWIVNETFTIHILPRSRLSTDITWSQHFFVLLWIFCGQRKKGRYSRKMYIHIACFFITFPNGEYVFRRQWKRHTLWLLLPYKIGSYWTLATQETPLHCKSTIILVTQKEKAHLCRSVWFWESQGEGPQLIVNVKIGERWNIRANLDIVWSSPKIPLNNFTFNLNNNLLHIFYQRISYIRKGKTFREFLHFFS